MIVARTWPYGTTRHGFVAIKNFRPPGLDPRASTAQIIVDELGEAHICVGLSGDPSAEVGDSGKLVFTKGGPTGGYWKFTKDDEFNIADDFNHDVIPNILAMFKTASALTIEELERDFPRVKWREPKPVPCAGTTILSLACRICIVKCGLAIKDAHKLPQTRAEFADHMRTIHNIEI